MKYMIITLILCMQSDPYMNFITLFPKAKYDEYGNYFTRKLSTNSYVDLKEQFTLISDNQSFKFLCDEDSSSLFYKYDLYQMEEGYLIEVVKEKYKHYAISSFQRDNYDMVLYSKYDSENERYYLKSFSKEGEKIDELLSNEIIYEGSSAGIDKFRFSIISLDNIKTFTYDDVVNPNKKDKKTPLITKVVIEDYSIDSLGRFTKVAVDSILLSQPVRAYTDFIGQPEGDDPARRYWTLW